MGFLAFLQRRQSDRTPASTSPPTATLSYQYGNAAAATTVPRIRKRNETESLSLRNASTKQLATTVQTEDSCGTPTVTSATNPSVAESQQLCQTGARPVTAPFGSMGLACTPTTESLPFTSSAKRRLSASSSYSDLLLSRTSSIVSASTISAAGRHVDLLDAHGQLGPSDFKARVKASGSREYGEDVAERNIGQNGLLLGSPAVQKFYATRVAPRRQNTNQSKYRKYANKETILEHPEIEDAYPRPSSRASSVYTARSMPTQRVRATSTIFDSPGYLEPQHTGRASSASSHATTSSIGLPKLETHNVRNEIEAEESDDAFPPSIPRYRRNERDSSLERPSSAMGSVRRARQSMNVMSAYNISGSITETTGKGLLNNNMTNKRLSHHQRANHVIQQQNLSIENMLRWRQSLGDVDEDRRSVLTERAADSRHSRRQWSITSTEPTEPSDVSSVNIRPLSRATVTTSVDIPSLMDPDEKSSYKTRPSYEVDRSQCGEDIETCSITTDGSNIDAFVEKQKRKAAQEDESLAFDESGFFSGGGALPGLFGLSDALPAPIAEEPVKEESASLCDSKKDGSESLQEATQTISRRMTIAIPPTATFRPRLASPLGPKLNVRVELTKMAKTVDADEDAEAAPDSPSLDGGVEDDSGSAEERELERTLQMEIQGGCDTAPEDDRCSSVATPESVPGSFVPKIYLTQRQRLLALGFDYDTDDDEMAALSDGEDDKAAVASNLPCKQHHREVPSLSPSRRLSVVLELPQKADEIATAGSDAARRRREAKKLTRGVGPRARVRRVDTSFDEADGNLADVE